MSTIPSESAEKLLPAVPYQEGNLIYLTTKHLIYVLQTNGDVAHFKEQATGTEHLDSSVPHPFMGIRKSNGVTYLPSTSITLLGSDLRVVFGDAPAISARVNVRLRGSHLVLRLDAIDNHDITSIELKMPLNLTKWVSTRLACCRDSSYAAAIIPLNIESHSNSFLLPNAAAHAVLMAEAHRQVRLEGFEFALLGCPNSGLLPIIEQIELEHGLPHPTMADTWARNSPEQRKSYLFIQGISTENTPRIIGYAKAGGFDYIMLSASDWSKTRGTYGAPETLDLKKVCEEIHGSGLKVGLHHQDLWITKDDPLATLNPPTPGLLTYPDRQLTLAADINATQTSIPTVESPQRLMGGSGYPGHDLRIDNEILRYGSLNTVPGSYGLEGCIRTGKVQNTDAASHSLGAKIDVYAEFGRSYIVDIQHPLHEKMLKRLSSIIEESKADLIYPDGMGENLAGYPNLPYWYALNIATSKFYFSIWRQLLFAQSPVSDYSWHVFSRGGTRDNVKRGILRHFDELRLKVMANGGRDLTPSELGWFGYFKWQPDRAATRPRELNYAWAKAVGYSAAISLETTESDLKGNGRTAENLEVIRGWENIKYGAKLSEEAMAALQEERKEFLLQALDRHPEAVIIRRANYSQPKHITSLEDASARWEVENSDASQPLRVSIEALPTFHDYGEDKNKILLDPKSLPAVSSSGPMGTTMFSNDKAKVNLTWSAGSLGPKGEATLHVSLDTSKSSASIHWGCIGFALKADSEGGVNLAAHRGLGTWVCGDGEKSSAYLHFVIEDESNYLARDYYVHLNFNGWQYVPMLRAAEGEVYDFNHGYAQEENYAAIAGFNFYKTQRLYVFLTNVDKIATEAASCSFTQVEALAEIPLLMVNPGIVVNGETVEFLGELQPEGYLEYTHGNTAKIFDKNGASVSEAQTQGAIPVMKTGKNSLQFLCKEADGHGQAARIEVLTYGKPLSLR